MKIQKCPLFNLPTEIKEIIHEYLFCTPLVDEKQTLRALLYPDDNPRKVETLGGPPAALIMCQQFKQELEYTCRRLPQAYRDLRYHAKGHRLNGFRHITPASWQQLVNLTITIGVEYYFDEEGVTHSMMANGLGCRYVADFARVLQTSDKLKRLRLVPTSMAHSLKYKWHPLDPTNSKWPYIRVDREILIQAWALLRPFAHLPAHVDVGISASWEGTRDNIWCDRYLANPRRNCYDEYIHFMQAGFTAVHMAFAGKPIRTSYFKYYVPALIGQHGAYGRFDWKLDLLDGID